jgi:hypothetical protein
LNHLVSFPRRVSSTGSLLWRRFYSAADFDAAYGVAVSGSSLFAGGVFTTTQTFGAITVTALGSSDGWVGKWNKGG